MDNTQEENIGYLIVKVSTARGAIPLEDATVSIRAEGAKSAGIVYSLETNSSGLTRRLPLPAPSRALSQEPRQSANSLPYSLWSVDVFCKGFISAKYISVPVYSGVTSIQSAELVPVPEGFLPSEIYNEGSGSPPFDLTLTPSDVKNGNTENSDNPNGKESL